MKKIEDYLSLNYEIDVKEEPQSFKGEYFSSYRQFKNVTGYGLTEKEAIKDAKKSFKRYLEVELKKGATIPKPKKYSERRNMSWNNEVHDMAKAGAKKYGFKSVSAYVSSLIIKKDFLNREETK